LFLANNGLACCDKSLRKRPTYVNEALIHESVIDYFFTSDDTTVSNYDVMDRDINFSDHLPITVTCALDSMYAIHTRKQIKDDDEFISQLRWDYGDTVSYYSYTGIHLQPILAEIDTVAKKLSAKMHDNVAVDIQLIVDILYSQTIKILISGAKLFIPVRKKNFLQVLVG